MTMSTVLDLLDSCDNEPELRMAHRLIGAELQLIVDKSPAAMRPQDFIQCSFAFRYLCHQALDSKISH